MGTEYQQPDDAILHAYNGIDYDSVNIQRYLSSKLMENKHIILAENRYGQLQVLVPLDHDMLFNMPNGKDVARITAGNLVQMDIVNDELKPTNVIAWQDVEANYQLKDEIMSLPEIRQIQELFISRWHALGRKEADYERALDGGLIPEESKAEFESLKEQTMLAGDRIHRVFVAMDHHEKWIKGYENSDPDYPQCPSGKLQTLGDIKVLTILGTDPEKIAEPQHPEFNKIITEIAKELPGWKKRCDMHAKDPREHERV